MRTYLDCYPCFLTQALRAARAVGAAEGVQRRLLLEVMSLLAGLEEEVPPPVIGRAVHRHLRELLSSEDPYRELKASATRRALELLPALRRRIERTGRPFAAAVALSAAANTIDLAVDEGYRQQELEQRLEAAFNQALPGEAVGRLEQAVAAAERIVFLADNAGELVLDRPLLELLGREKTTVVVRGGPAINDAVRADAEAAGLEGFALADTGDDAPGVIPADAGAELRALLAGADLVIAKGQGNFEGLSGEKLPLFFLLKAKCPVIARHIGCAVGELLVLDRRSG